MPFHQAIAIDNRNHVFFSNRSAAYLSQGAAASALSDARRVVTLKPEWPKGYSRLGAALFALKRYEESLDAYNQGVHWGGVGTCVPGLCMCACVRVHATRGVSPGLFCGGRVTFNPAAAADAVTARLLSQAWSALRTTMR